MNIKGTFEYVAKIFNLIAEGKSLRKCTHKEPKLSFNETLSHSDTDLSTLSRSDVNVDNSISTSLFPFGSNLVSYLKQFGINFYSKLQIVTGTRIESQKRRPFRRPTMAESEPTQQKYTVPEGLELTPEQRSYYEQFGRIPKPRGPSIKTAKVC
jgi:hypothetical protein